MYHNQQQKQDSPVGYDYQLSIGSQQQQSDASGQQQSDSPTEQQQALRSSLSGPNQTQTSQILSTNTAEHEPRAPIFDQLNFNNYCKSNPYLGAKRGPKKQPPPSQNPTDCFLQFLASIGDLESTPMSATVLGALTRLLPEKVNAKVNVSIVGRYVDRREVELLHTKVRAKRWDMHDYLVLLWLVSKICEFNIYSCIESLTNQDYRLIMQILPCAEPTAQVALKQLKDNPYTDRWKQSESVLLYHIVTNYKYRKGVINFEAVAQQLLARNQEPKAIYRCRVQCEREWKIIASCNREWTSQEDTFLLGLVDKEEAQLEGISWKSMEIYFEKRTEFAIKARFQHLLKKIKGMNRDYAGLPTKQLVRQYLQGKIKHKRVNKTNVALQKFRAENSSTVSQLGQNKGDDNTIDKGLHPKTDDPYVEYRHLQTNKNSSNAAARNQQIAGLMAQLATHIHNAENALAAIKNLQSKAALTRGTSSNLSSMAQAQQYNYSSLPVHYSENSSMAYQQGNKINNQRRTAGRSSPDAYCSQEQEQQRGQQYGVVEQQQPYYQFENMQQGLEQQQHQQ